MTKFWSVNGVPIWTVEATFLAK